MLGAQLRDGGCHFRVWAPNAKAAHVVGDFNNWTDAPANLMQQQGGGYWDGFIPGAQAGQNYRFHFVDWQDEVHLRIDPAARDTHHSGMNPSNAGIIVANETDWPPFETPDFSNLIIYQLHTGSFAGHNDGLPAPSGVARIKTIETKLGYIREMGFNAIQLLPVNEFSMDRSWGYNPSFYYSLESAYGTPGEFRAFVKRAHEAGLAVLFDVVYNHVSNSDNSFWSWDVFDNQRGEYLYPPAFETPWGAAPSFHKPAVIDFFAENAWMLFEEYRIDGLRFDATRYVEYNTGQGNDGFRFLQELTWRIKLRHPDKYLIAEHLPDHESIIRDVGMNATWVAASHHDFQRAAGGSDPVNLLKSFIGKNFGGGRNYSEQWNLVKYPLGSHDDCGDDKGGTSVNGADWEQHRYFVEFFGGRDNWYARAKARIGWALSAGMMGTPQLFMGGECHHWGYWHDGGDFNGDHRFDWNLAGDPIGMAMRQLVTAANWVRWENPCLRGEFLDFVHEDFANGVLAFKRYLPGASNTVLVVVNMGDGNFGNHSYGVLTGGQAGQWTQILCSQDAPFGGWDGAGNAFHVPWTQPDGRIYINLPQWSVVMMRLL